VAFLKVDVDQVQEAAAEQGVTAMPTFMLYKDGKKVDEVVGANPGKLRAAVQGLRD
jgi:thioredoxin 1